MSLSSVITDDAISANICRGSRFPQDARNHGSRRAKVCLCGLVVAEGAYPQPVYPIRRDCSAKALKYVASTVIGV